MSPVQTIETEGGSETFFEWIQRNSRLVTIGAALVVVAAAGWWFYLRSAEIKRLNAERGLNQAKQSLAAGNAALATTDLQRVATRYKGTPAGAQAAMVLAQLNFQQGKFAEGVQALEPYHSERSAGPSLAAVWALTGDGQASQGKLDDAVASYRKASDASDLGGFKALYMAQAARTLMAGGKTAEAKTIWESLATDPDAAVVQNEAAIRLGEIAAQSAAAGKS
jgi:predicted negative regulator of RcsB-dependent stress response